jgi:hypothetical protein
MTDDATPTARPAAPLIQRRSLIAGTVVTIGALAALPAFAEGEGGEGGEGAGLPEGVDPAAGFLFTLGQFEAQVLIAQGLVAKGDAAAARAHLQASDHDDYEAIEAGVEGLGAPKFEDETRAFATAVAGDDPAAVDAAATAVLAASLTARSNAGPGDLAKAIELLLRDAAGDFEAGVKDGKVTEAQEYRDAWGYVQAARGFAAQLAALADDKAQAFATTAVKALDGTAAALPDVGATEVTGKADDIYGAAARVELAAYPLAKS